MSIKLFAHAESLVTNCVNRKQRLLERRAPFEPSSVRINEGLAAINFRG